MFPKDSIEATRLVALRKGVEQINAEKLSNINFPAIHYNAIDWGDKVSLEAFNKQCQAQRVCSLKPGEPGT